VSAEPSSDLAAVQAEYRKWFWTVIGHTIFFALCIIAAVALRRMFRMPPALLTVPFFIALLLFGGDLLKFLSWRRRLRALREADTTSS
jgi:hypothetical protein